MAISPQSDEGRLLRKYVPLESFPIEAFNELCASIEIEEIEDNAIFQRGDSNPDLIYLLSGSVVLRADDLVVCTISAGSDSARFALAHQIPRKIDAFANGAARIVRLDADTVNNPPPAVYQENQGFMLEEDLNADSDDWMSALLRLPLFQGLSPSHLQKIMISVKSAHYAEGEVIVDKGSQVENFYLVTKGQCLLTRNTNQGAAQFCLNPGDSFGEEYLIVDKPSQETVMASSEVSILYLQKSVFLSELKKPMIRHISAETLGEAVQHGAIVLDVRQPVAFEKNNLSNSANIPLMSLRFRLNEIPKDKTIIVVCANGITSEAAGFLLAKDNINAVVLKDGLGNQYNDEEEGQEQEELVDDELENSVSASTLSPTVETDVLAENTRLKQANLELSSRVAQLENEKQEAEQRILVLSQQLNRLKDILARLTKSK